MNVEDFTEGERRTLAGYWRQRAEGEYTSWVAFGQVRQDLVALRAHPQTIALAHRAVEDERRHAEWCLDWSEKFGATRNTIRARDEKPLRFSGAPEHLMPLLRVAFCCMTETLGCFVLQAQRPFIALPELKKLNQRHLADEIQHSRVGWSFLAGMTETQRDELRPWIRPLTRILLEVASAGTEENHEALLGGGYFTKSLLEKAGRQALSHVIEPGLIQHKLLEAA